VSANNQQLPQPYRYKVAAAKFQRLKGTLVLEAPTGMNEQELDALTNTLEMLCELAEIAGGKQ